MKIGMFMYSEWFKNDIYVSPNENIYCIYPFDTNKILIMDEDMTEKQYIDILNGNEEYYDSIPSSVLVYWMYDDGDISLRKETIKCIVNEYENNSRLFFEKYNTKGRN